MLALKLTLSSAAIALISIGFLSLEHSSFSPSQPLPNPPQPQSLSTPATPMSLPSDSTAPQLKPVVLTRNVAVPLPGTELKVTLQDYRYGRGRDTNGQDKVSAWANLQFDLPSGQQETIHWTFYETREIGGYRLHLDGSRSEVLLYVLPTSSSQ